MSPTPTLRVWACLAFHALASRDLSAQALTPPPQEHVLQFSGIGGASTLPTSAQQINVGPNLTIELWVYLTSASPGAFLMGKADNMNAIPGFHYTLNIDQSGFKPMFIQSAGTPGSQTSIKGHGLPLNVWTHLAAVLDAGTMRLYANGQLLISGPSLGAPRSTSLSFSVGSGYVNGVAQCHACPFHGAAREARVWSRALSASELRLYAARALTGNEPGLAANWRLAEGSGNIANAIGPQATPLTIQGAANWVQSKSLPRVEPFWELHSLPPFPGVPASYFGGWGGVFQNPSRRPDIWIGYGPGNYVANDGGPVVFYRNQGNRVFSAVMPTPPIVVVGSAAGIASDLDRDGLEDVVVSGGGLDFHPWPGGITRLLMQRSGGMLDETSTRLALPPAFTHDVCAADIDKDGDTDLMYADTNSPAAPLQGPKLYVNDGSGRFIAANGRLPLEFQPALSLGVVTCMFADFNRDGAPDLLFAPKDGTASGRDFLLQNDGAGNFRDVSATSIPPKRGGNDWFTLKAASADFNRDGWLDIVLTSTFHYTKSVTQFLINNRDGTFRDQPDPVLNLVHTDIYDSAVYAHDLNQDGWVDLVVAQGGSNTSLLLYQNMGGRFEDRTATLNPDKVHGASVADFDGDQKLDILLLGAPNLIAYGNKPWPGVAVATPAISSVRMAGGAPDISPNGWIEIKGTDLAPLNVPAGGATWSDAREFVSGQMPREVGAVTVTVDGRPAYVYFVSPSQVNVLAPVGLTQGTVPVVLTSGGRSSAPFNVTVHPAAPSFPLFGSKYIVATHADATLIGPASLSAPGYPVTPAKPGETILLYGFGFGLPTTPLIDGAASQSGVLPTLPTIQIGGVSATVVFAGVISPGLYQCNVIVPPGLPDGDAGLSLLYEGSSAPAGGIIVVKR